MSKFLASVILGLCIFLGNLSAQAKAYDIVEHLSSDHSVQEKHSHHHHDDAHHHDHDHDHKKKNHKSNKHDHSMELSTAMPSLFCPQKMTPEQQAPAISSIQHSFIYSEVTISSFLDSIFRPPIA